MSSWPEYLAISPFGGVIHRFPVCQIRTRVDPCSRRGLEHPVLSLVANDKGRSMRQPVGAAVQCCWKSCPWPKNTVCNGVADSKMSTFPIKMTVHQPVQGLDKRLTRGDETVGQPLKGLCSAWKWVLNAKEMNLATLILNEAVIVEHPCVRLLRVWFVNQAERSVNDGDLKLREYTFCFVNHGVSFPGQHGDDELAQIGLWANPTLYVDTMPGCIGGSPFVRDYPAQSRSRC